MQPGSGRIVHKQEWAPDVCSGMVRKRDLQTGEGKHQGTGGIVDHKVGGQGKVETGSNEFKGGGTHPGVLSSRRKRHAEDAVKGRRSGVDQGADAEDCQGKRLHEVYVEARRVQGHTGGLCYRAHEVLAPGIY